MKTKYVSFIVFLICLLSTTHIYSQNNQAKKTTTLYTYTFSGEMNGSSITQMETALQQLTNVTEAKVKYKEEKQQGQLMVIVKELPRKSEGDILFEPIDLKKTIAEFGLMPKEIHSETLLKP